MTKKHIFTTAHKIAKGIVKEVGNYQLPTSFTNGFKRSLQTSKNLR